MHDMTITIRRGIPTDVEPIARLHHDVWHETQAPFQPDVVRASRDLDFFRSRVAVFTGPPLVAERGTEVVGFCGWDHGYIGQLYLARDVRGQGVGRRLLQATETALLESGATEARLVVLAGNTEARLFFERNAWRVVNEQPIQIDTNSGPVQVGAWHMAKTLA